MEVRIIEDNIKPILVKKMENSIHAKVGKLNERIDTLFKIHRSWVIFAFRKLTYEEMAESISKYDKNICKY